jgi:hypothetical protein
MSSMRKKTKLSFFSDGAAGGHRRGAQPDCPSAYHLKHRPPRQHCVPSNHACSEITLPAGQGQALIAP